MSVAKQQVTRGNQEHELPLNPSDPVASYTKLDAATRHLCRPTTIEGYRLLDEGEILEGYLDGIHGEPRPTAECSVSYDHGWSNAMRDRGDRPFDDDDAALARQFDRLR